MSGYGMPQGPTPGSPRSGRTGPALPVLELVGVGLAVLAFIVAFLPWAKPDVRLPAGASVDSVNGWNLALPTVGDRAAAGRRRAGRGAAADQVGRGRRDRAPCAAASPVPALLACLGALFMLVWVLIGGKYLGTDLNRGIGTWLGLVLGLGTAAVLVLSWLQRTGRTEEGAGRRPVQLEPGPAAGLGPAKRRLPAAPGLRPARATSRRATASRRASRWASRPAYGQQPSYGGPGGYGPNTGGQPAAAVRAGAVPAADRRGLPGAGRRLPPAGLTRELLGAPALVRGGAL